MLSLSDEILRSYRICVFRKNLGAQRAVGRALLWKDSKRPRLVLLTSSHKGQAYVRTISVVFRRDMQVCLSRLLRLMSGYVYCRGVLGFLKCCAGGLQGTSSWLIGIFRRSGALKRLRRVKTLYDAYKKYRNIQRASVYGP